MSLFQPLYYLKQQQQQQQQQPCQLSQKAN